MTAKYVVNDKDRDSVIALAGVGTHRDLIANYLGIDSHTVSKYYGDLIEKTMTARNQKVANTLFKKAVVDGNVVAIIFWLKCQARWKEVKDDTTPDMTNSDLIKALIAKLPE
jgi:hypothetical protein